jgi:hypothetical protein
MTEELIARGGAMRRLLWTTVLSLVASSAWAQSTMYSCRSTNGSYMSTRPCPPVNDNADGSTRLRVYDSVENTPAYRNATRPSPSSSGYLPTPPRAEKHLEYLSPRCAEVAEALRTGPSRGVRGDVISELHREFRANCADEDRAARTQAQQRESAERDQRQSQQRMAVAAKEQSKFEVEQCQEMLRILTAKRKRLDSMTDGEKQDFQRFSDNHKARCGAR